MNTRKPRFTITLISLLYLLASPITNATEVGMQQIPTRLKHNPFIMPDFFNPKITSNTNTDNIPGLSINGVLLNDNNSLIIINSKILGINDAVDGYRLIRLTEQKAVLTKNGQETTLYLPNSKNFGKDK